MIRERRKELGMNADTLAEKLKVSRSTIYRWENGEINKIPIDLIPNIAEALDTTPVYLAGWSEAEPDGIHSLQDLYDTIRVLEEYAKEDGADKGLINYLEALKETKIQFEQLNPNILEGKKPTSPGSKWIPVLDKVAAGLPIEAVAGVLDYAEITPDMGREYFALQIRGNSMEPRIYENDVVIVRVQSDVESGDLAIVRINGSDATCKKILKYKGGITLVSNNTSYEPLFFSNEQVKELPVEIIGKVVELRGKC
ncbi:MAG: helix-turn-helix domain-containing protein [Eubacteriaceae bacterium]|nr:helix-turn-helix domain-containing protein [Eubacteriaceae bacterium]